MGPGLLRAREPMHGHTQSTVRADLQPEIKDCLMWGAGGRGGGQEGGGGGWGVE